MAIYRVSLGVYLLAVVAGCGRQTVQETIVVTGTVMYQGSPVEKGRVTFQPQSTSGVRPATGEINAGGIYSLSTFAAGDGAKPGDYKVLIESFEGGASPENPRAKQVWLVPEKYSRAETSELTATVPEDARGPIELNFDLE